MALRKFIQTYKVCRAVNMVKVALFVVFVVVCFNSIISSATSGGTLERTSTIQTTNLRPTILRTNTKPAIQYASPRPVSGIRPALNSSNLQRPFFKADDIYVFPEIKSVETVLLPNTPPLTVYYMWCHRDKYFEYANYLSVLSVLKVIRPHKIVFHYKHLPKVDTGGYITWFEELRSKIPNLILKHVLHLTDCSENASAKLNLILQKLSGNGGIYVNENIVITQFIHDDRKRNPLVDSNINAGSNALELLLTTGRQSLPGNEKHSNIQLKLKCAAISHYNRNEGEHRCIKVNDNIRPRDIWELKTDFGSIARLLHYGVSDAIKPKPDNASLIPRISHYVWLGDKAMDYGMYLSILSAIYVAAFERVYIHGNNEPNGIYWERLKQTEPKVIFNRVDIPETVFGTAVKVPSHSSDLLRVYMLILYGGVYQDVNAFWVNRVPDDVRAYETVATFDWPIHGHWPDTFNIGVLMAKRNSRYLRAFLPTFKNYKDSNWGFNAIDMPYKVYENHPDWMYVNPRLQVICYLKVCHPTWMKNFKISMSSRKTTDNFNWRNDTLAIHFTGPLPGELKSPEILRKSTGYVSDIGRYILQKAGKW